MAIDRAKPRSIDDYIAACPPATQAILQQIRRTVHNAAPDAEESISYGMPTFAMHGTLVHFASFKNHIGFYPPVRGDEKLMKAVQPYAGEKGNLRFALDQPIPHQLIARIVKLRLKQNRIQAAAAVTKSSAPRGK